jgi:hypothetical protein
MQGDGSMLATGGQRLPDIVHMNARLSGLKPTPSNIIQLGGVVRYSGPEHLPRRGALAKHHPAVALPQSESRP